MTMLEVLSTPTGDYYVGAEPCRDRFSVAKGSSNPVAIGVGIGGACVGVIAILFVCYMIKREKSGKALFHSSGSIS